MSRSNGFVKLLLVVFLLIGLAVAAYALVQELRDLGYREGQIQDQAG